MTKRHTRRISDVERKKGEKKGHAPKNLIIKTKKLEGKDLKGGGESPWARNHPHTKKKGTREKRKKESAKIKNSENESD